MDLVGRKWSQEKGAVFSRWMQGIKYFWESNHNYPGFKKEFEQLGKAIQAYEQIQETMAGFAWDKDTMGLIPTFAKRILMASGELIGGKMLLEQALLADKKAKELGEDHYDYNFYQGKIMATRYYLLNEVH